MTDQEKDPLSLGGLDPDLIDMAVTARSSKRDPEKVMLARAKEERLAKKEARISKGIGGGGDVPLPTPNVAAPEVSVEERSAMLDKILAYRERFGHLKKRNKCDGRSSPEELQDELHYIEKQLGSAGSDGGGMSIQLFCGAMHGLEVVTRDHFNPLGLTLDGLGQVTRDNSDQFAPILDELAIKYGSGLSMPPEWRLAIAVGTLVMTVNSANKGDPRLAASLQKMSQPVQVPAQTTDL